MERMFFTNNSRKMFGIPLRRKKDKRKRIYTRNRAEEELGAFVDYFDGKWDEKLKAREDTEAAGARRT